MRLPLALVCLALLLSACGGDSGPPMKRIAGGGASVAVPEPWVVHPNPPDQEVISAGETDLRQPGQPGVQVSRAVVDGSFDENVQSDLTVNLLGLVDYDITSPARHVAVPGAKQARQAEAEFTTFKGSRRWRTHVWVRYATPDSSLAGPLRFYELAVVVPSVAKHKPDVPAILKSFELTG